MRARNSAIEIYRVLLMLGIVTLHQFSYVGMGHHWVPQLLASCVVGFVFISGYFGIKFSWSKMAKLYGVALFCAGWNGICNILTGGGQFLATIVANLRVWWFVNAYIMLMLMTPILNQALNSCGDKRRLVQVALPMILLVFVWEFLTIVSGVKEVIPADRGFGTHNGLTLVGIYVAARLYRMLELESKLPRWGWGALWCVSGAFCAVNLGKYNSPFALAFAAASFTLMKQFGEASAYRFFSPVGKLCLFLGPSMLSVYLLHVGGVLHLPFVQAISTDSMSAYFAAQHISIYPSLILIIAATFAICVIIDLLRRMILSLGRRVFNH